jgi:outer membrane scaffolding protein for murein synthesis (MipA/OmpV family)
MNIALSIVRLLCPARVRPAAAALVLLLAPPSARAELSDETLLGLGLRSQPAYDGSASQRLAAVPVIRYLGQTAFARSTQGVLEGGVRLELAPGLHAGAQLAYEPGRKTSDSDLLQNHGVADVDPGASVGGQVEWDHMFGPMPITLLARARQNIKADRGAQVDLRLSAGAYRGARVGAGAFAQTTWANARSTGSIYDVTTQQSAATGLPVFRAAGGWLFASFGLLWSIDLNRDWIAVGSMESRHLRGDAARSPIVERTSNYYASAGLSYRF